MDATNAATRFSINGEYMYETTMASNPKRMLFSCSSAICSFEVLQ
jgi:hypothetical protein